MFGISLFTIQYGTNQYSFKTFRLVLVLSILGIFIFGVFREIGFDLKAQ
jgi:hypothetical protein